MRLAKRVGAISSSATLDITSRAKKMMKDGIDIVSFGAGEPDFDTPDHIKTAAINAINEGYTKYTASSGSPELREAISRKFKRDNALDYQASQIVVSSGAKHSLYNILQAICEPGDEIVIPSPFWLSYPEMVKLAEGVPIFLNTEKANNFKLTGNGLNKVITKKTKALVLNSPSNPTGSVYELSELESIAKSAIKNNYFVISDEIYEKLIYDGKKHISIASLGNDIKGLAITVNGVSKSYSMTGWRIGYAAGPVDVMAAISNMQSHAASNPSSISQRAALAALTGDQGCVARMRDEFEKRRNLMISKLNAIKNISCVRPEGAFYIFCDISKLKIGSIALAQRLLSEAKVAVVPGEPFGADSFIRLSFAISGDNIEKGLNRIEEWVAKNG